MNVFFCESGQQDCEQNQSKQADRTLQPVMNLCFLFQIQYKLPQQWDESFVAVYEKGLKLFKLEQPQNCS
jgi:hypothetical protein